jgi:hypothetical protein
MGCSRCDELARNAACGRSDQGLYSPWSGSSYRSRCQPISDLGRSAQSYESQSCKNLMTWADRLRDTLAVSLRLLLIQRQVGWSRSIRLLLRKCGGCQSSRMNIVLNAEEYRVLQSLILPGDLRLINQLPSGYVRIEVSPDIADILRDRCSEKLVSSGLDEHYNPNELGKRLNSLIDKLFVG